ncbi:hypothetical protein [Aestuariirhabdus sp. LZHN29]|uniref:hypothetical protein n=1 Tax=Aestuariirhabdus sp. LZHN29 TaxID=3417462 RepID=UPI003CF9618B
MSTNSITLAQRCPVRAAVRNIASLLEGAQYNKVELQVNSLSKEIFAQRQQEGALMHRSTRKGCWHGVER